MLRTRRPRAIGALLTGLSLALLSVAITPSTARAQTVEDIEKVLDHFRCYTTVGAAVNQFALLLDQFDRRDGQVDFAIVLRPFWFCNPVQKNDLAAGEVTPVVDPLHHLTFYTMLDFPSGPDRTIQVENQFGSQVIQTSGVAVALGVPTDKNSEGTPEKLDHFKCYRARGEPVNRSFEMFDQFLIDPEVRVLEPVLFCNPTFKFHAGALTPIENGRAHLTCYRTPLREYTDLITAENQFLAQELPIGPPGPTGAPTGAVGLCVPSLKFLPTVGTS